MSIKKADSFDALFRPRTEAHLCLLPNGTSICWASVYQQVKLCLKPEQYERTKDDKKLREEAAVPSDEKKKGYSYARANLWKTKGQSENQQALIVADFDELPAGFTDYDALEKHFHDNFPNAVTGRSRQNKVKLFFVVEFEKGKKLNNEIALKFLTSLMGQGLAKVADDKAFGHTLITTSIIEAFKGVHKLEPHKIQIPDSTKKVLTIEEWKKNVKEKPSRRFKGDIPDELQVFIRGTRQRNTKTKEDFIRILLAHSLLLRESGFQLGVNRLAIECNTDKATISRWLTKLIQKGQLRQVSSRYVTGLEAKRYQAVGELAKTIATHAKPTPALKLPTNPKDGEWHKAIADIAYQFSLLDDEAGYWKYVESLPGYFDKDDREAKAKGLWRYYHKKYG